MMENRINNIRDDFTKELRNIPLPEFPDNSFNIKDFSAVSGGEEKTTAAINSAINECSQQGGGTVIIPRGIWLTGPIYLQDNVNLHLEEGALVLFSRDFADYPLIQTTYEGQKQVRCTSPINGENLTNIAITGQGVIDGSGHIWRPVKRYKVTDKMWNKLVASGGVVDDDDRIWWPSENALHGPEIVKELQEKNAPIEEYEKVREYLRPVLLSLIKCKNVLLDGPVFQNSPAWNIHPLLCENLIIQNITVRNEAYAQNGDGIDLDSCKNVYLHDAMFDVGDDAICLKSGKNEQGRKRGVPCEDMLIENCKVYAGHGGFVIGSEMSGGVKNIKVQNCTFMGTDCGLRFKTTRGRGGIVENIFINDINMIDIKTEPIRFNMFYAGRSDGSEEVLFDKKPVTEETPVFKQIYINNVSCRGAKKAVKLEGLPEMFIDKIYIEDVQLLAQKGIECVNAHNLEFINTDVKVEDEVVIEIMQGQNIKFENMNIDQDNQIIIKGRDTDKIKFVRCDFPEDYDGFVVAPDLEEKENLILFSD